MNTLDGMIADLERDDTRIGGCTTAGEVVTMLKQLRDDAIVIPAGATNGDVIMTTLKKYVSNMRCINSFVIFHISIPEGEYVFLESTLSFPTSFWNAPYEKEEGDN